MTHCLVLFLIFPSYFIKQVSYQNPNLVHYRVQQSALLFPCSQFHSSFCYLIIPSLASFIQSLIVLEPSQFLLLGLFILWHFFKFYLKRKNIIFWLNFTFFLIFWIFIYINIKDLFLLNQWMYPFFPIFYFLSVTRHHWIT